MSCAVAVDTKLETPEGPLTMRTVAKTPCSVMTRTDDGKVRFHMTKDARVVGEARPTLRITLENDLTLRVGEDQVLFKDGMQEVRAVDIRPGDQLVSAFAFPTGYVYRTDEGEERTSQGTVAVKSIEPVEPSDVYGFRVNRTGRFVFSAGVVGKAEGP
jgi:hypothetical protein